LVDIGDNLRLAAGAISAHKLRAILSILGLTMGVAALVTVMTIVQGANVYVEQKIANLGTNVFRVSKTPFAVTDFTVYVKALKNKNIYPDDLGAVAERCRSVRIRRRLRQRHALDSIPEQAGGRHHHLRLHAEYGRDRYAHP
jgi:hypothetical protein